MVIIAGALGFARVWAHKSSQSPCARILTDTRLIFLPLPCRTLRQDEVKAFQSGMNASSPSRRICLVLPSGIGDVVHGLPLVNALKRDDPQRHITWVVEPQLAPLLQPHSAVDEVILFDRRGGFRGVQAMRRDLRSRRFDVVLNCGIYFKSAIPTFFAQAPHKIGFGPDRAFDLVWMFATDRLPPQGSRHRQDMYLEHAEFLSVDPGELEWRLVITEKERAAQREFFTNANGDRVVGVVTTSAKESKDWPVERYAELVTALASDFGFRVVLLGGPDAREQGRARTVAGRCGPDATWALGPDLRRLIYLTDGCNLLIAPDTGPLHIARALGTPVIGLYGHTNPQLSGPYRAFEHLTVDRFNYDAPGQPYSGPERRFHPARPGARPGRMELISVADVLEKIQLAVDDYSTTGAPRVAS